MFNISPLISLRNELVGVDGLIKLSIPLKVTEEAYTQNEWFDKESIEDSLLAICNTMLTPEALTDFCNSYSHHKSFIESVTIVAAGNIPFVSFADVLYSVLCNVKVYIKYSSKDRATMRWLISSLNKYLPYNKQVEEYSSQQTTAVIATGSANSNRYFNYNFSRCKSIFRSSRSSIAVLSGNESLEDLRLLFHDIFDYYGQGCRNVSLLLIPKEYDIMALFRIWCNSGLRINNKHFNSCYKRAKAVREIENSQYIDGGYFIAEESNSLFAPISLINYHYYTTPIEAEDFISDNKDKIQCVISNIFTNSIPFGKGQSPLLSDFADNIDVIDFLAR